VLAIVPVKGLDGAKTRLAEVLSASERADLVVTMLDCVLEACSESEAVRETLVVTPDPRVARGDDMLIDEGAGHAPAIARALADARARAGAIVVMADCPLVLPEAIDRLAAAAEPVAIARASDGGMNALALRDPSAFEPAFGVRHSALRTEKRARAAGIDAVVVDDPLLAFDVDRPADLERLRGLVAA
jgi:2-phospho-L-lactate guanylyltransferase